MENTNQACAQHFRGDLLLHGRPQEIPYSTGQDIFVFIASCSEQEHERETLSPTTRDECLMASLSVPFASCNLRVAIHPFVLISDVSEVGEPAGESARFMENINVPQTANSIIMKTIEESDRWLSNIRGYKTVIQIPRVTVWIAHMLVV